LFITLVGSEFSYGNWPKYVNFSAAKLMFAQLTELLNHSMNCGLPPNLAVGEPSVDYSLKGVDISAAAYLSGK
jgi:hypothetical protein